MTTEQHTNAIFINAVDNKGKLRNIGLFYRCDDSWFGGGGISDDAKIYTELSRLISADKNIMAFQGATYNLENGIYRKSREFWPSLV